MKTGSQLSSHTVSAGPSNLVAEIQASTMGVRKISRRSAFTMVEIAISLGIIAFALVAIIGILPTGLKVQQENREETFITQEGLYWMEVIRSGGRGLDHLTNFVEAIALSYLNETNTYVTPLSEFQGVQLTNGMHIVGLLSYPKIEVANNGNWRSNVVVARVRPLNGNALDRSKQMEDMAFRYEMIVEVVPFTNRPPVWNPSSQSDLLHTTNLLHNLYDVRLNFRYPLILKGQAYQPGRGRKTFRTLVSGKLERYKPVNSWAHSLYFFQTDQFTPTNTARIF